MWRGLGIGLGMLSCAVGLVLSAGEHDAPAAVFLAAGSLSIVVSVFAGSRDEPPPPGE